MSMCSEQFSYEEVAKMIAKEFLTVQEAETLTGRKAATWRRDVLERRIPYVKLGRLVRIPRAAIEDLIRRGYRKAIEQAESE